ncbi:unnamed protein product, partial [marine sediment metagenome]
KTLSINNTRELAIGSYPNVYIFNLSPLTEYMEVGYENGIISFESFIFYKKYLTKKIERQKNKLLRILKNSDYYALGQVGYLPFLKKIAYINKDEEKGNFEAQKKFLLGLRTKEGKENFWKFIGNRSNFDLNTIPNWTIRVYAISKDGKPREILEESEEDKKHIGKRRVDYHIQKKRKETSVTFRIIIEGIPFFLILIIRAVKIGIETERGDLLTLKFTDLFYKYLEGYKYQKKGSIEYNDKLVFKIDPGFSMKSIATITLCGIKPEY